MKTKNKWHRVCAGLYKLGDIEVDRRYHSSGPCARNEMWHVVVNGKSVEKHAYLSCAKEAAVLLSCGKKTDAQKINEWLQRESD